MNKRFGKVKWEMASDQKLSRLANGLDAHSKA